MPPTEGNPNADEAPELDYDDGGNDQERDVCCAMSARGVVCGTGPWQCGQYS